MQSITAAILALIIAHIFSQYDLQNLALPTVICTTCRMALTRGKVTKIDIFDYTKIPPYHKTRSKAADCTCFLCLKWKVNISSKPKQIIKPSITPNNICPTCHQTTGKGISHKCNKEEFFKSAYNLIYSKGEKLAEQLATEVLMNKHSDCNETDFVLSNRNGERGLRVPLGKIPELPQYSHENALKIRNQLNCSDNHFNK